MFVCVHASKVRLNYTGEEKAVWVLEHWVLFSHFAVILHVRTSVLVASESRLTSEAILELQRKCVKATNVQSMLLLLLTYYTQASVG